MQDDAVRQPDEGARRPRPMSRTRLAGLALGAAGVAIAAGPCQWLADLSWMTTTAGIPPEARLQWRAVEPAGPDEAQLQPPPAVAAQSWNRTG